MKVWEMERESELDKVKRETERTWKSEIAFQEGGQEAVERLADDYEVNQSKKKAAAILDKLKEKMHNI